MKPLPLEFTFPPDAIRGDHDPYEPMSWDSPGQPERYSVTAIRIGETWVPACDLDEAAREELNHYMLAVIREEAEAAKESHDDWLYEQRRDRELDRKWEAENAERLEQRLRRAV